MHKVAYLLSDGFQLMALATQSVFEMANRALGEPFYELACYSETGGGVQSSSGVEVQTRMLAARTQADTWMVIGVLDPVNSRPTAGLLEGLRRCQRHARRVAGLCTGAFVMAEAGLLDDRRATTHWAFANEFRSRFGRIEVDEDAIYLVDERMWTSAGMSAAIDLALALVENDLGVDLARGVARKLVMPQRRTGGQTQHSELLNIAPKSDRIERALTFARAHMTQDLGVERLAEVATLSPRQFSRLFTAETGQSPARAIEGLRLEAARLMIERGHHSFEVIARECGFRDGRHLREVFQRRLGVAPQVLRRVGATGTPQSRYGLVTKSSADMAESQLGATSGRARQTGVARRRIV